MTNNSRGFGSWAIVAVIGVILIDIIGYAVYSKTDTDKTATNTDAMMHEDTTASSTDSHMMPINVTSSTTVNGGTDAGGMMEDGTVPPTGPNTY